MNEVEKIKSHFNKADHSYDSHCQLQMTVGENLINFIKHHSHSYPRIMDLGCGTGIVSQRFASEFSHQEFHAIDIANSLLAKAKTRLLPIGANVYETDFDDLPPYHQAFDLVFSNMSLQWSANLTTTLQNLKNILNPQAIIAFSIPLTGTLTELKHNFSLNHFLSQDLIQQQLAQCGYDVLIQHREKKILRFDNLLAMLRSIKDVGANFVGKRIHKGLRGKSFLQVRMAQQLTYVIGYFIAQKKCVL